MTDSIPRTATTRGPIRAPRGATLSCKGWRQEAALRMLMNSLDPEVAERPETLTIHANQKAARDWESYDAIVAALHELEGDQTLVVESGKLADVTITQSEAPRVLIANGHLDWFYTGTQSALHTAYMVFAAAAQKHFGGTLAGKLVVSGGVGGVGGAQSLAAAWNGAAFLGIDANAEHIKRRLKGGYCDVLVNDLDEAMRILKNAVRKREPASVGLIGNCADVIPALAERGIVPDLLTDQTLAHDPLAYLPRGLELTAADELRRRDPNEYRRRALDSIAAHVRAMLDLRKLGSIVFEFGNGLRAQAQEAGVPEASTISGVSEYLRPLFEEGSAPLLWVALSGEASDIHHLDDVLLKEFSSNESLVQWIRRMQRRGRFEGLPARVCWLSQDEQVRLATITNELVGRGELKAPIAFGYCLDRDSPDLSSYANGVRVTALAAMATVSDLPLSIGQSNLALWAIQGSASNSSRGTHLMALADGSPR